MDAQTLRNYKNCIRDVLFLITLLLPAIALAKASESKRYDIRILIDTSAQMKQADPQRQRIEAIQLFIKLLPMTAQAGIWQFDSDIRQLAPISVVNNAWRKTAYQALAKLHASNSKANLGKAIQIATADWHKPDASTKRTLIILSDGIKENLVDHLLLNSTLKQLHTANASVHTLSVTDQKQLPILEKLAKHTGGLNLTVGNSHDLLKAITLIFEATIDTQGVLMANNHFNVDKSIQALSILIFHDHNEKKPTVKKPDGKLFTNTQHPSNIIWQHEKNYDLITISKPSVGQWRIIGNISNDSLTMITSDLHLNVSVIERHLFATETMLISTSLSKQESTIRDKNSHNFVSIYLRQQIGNEVTTQVFSPKKTPLIRGFSGVFDTMLEASPGLQSLTIIAESPSFTRVKRQFIMVGAKPLHFEELVSSKHLQRKLEITLNPTVLDINTAKIKLRHSNSDEYIVKQDGNNKHRWYINFKDFHKGKQQSLYINVYGKTISGRLFSYESAKIILSGNIIPLRYYKSTIAGNITLKPIVKPKPKYQPVFVAAVPFKAKQLPLRLATFSGENDHNLLQINMLVSLMMFVSTSSISLLLATLWRQLRRRKLNKLQEVLTNVSTK